MTNDLWGELPPARPLPDPLALLEEQGRFLFTKSNGLLTGVVDAQETKSGFAGLTAGVRATFFVVSQFLDEYRFPVLGLQYDRIKVFPLTFQDMANGRNSVVDSEANLNLRLQETLRSENVQNGIANLRSAAEAAQRGESIFGLSKRSSPTSATVRVEPPKRKVQQEDFRLFRSEMQQELRAILEGLTEQIAALRNDVENAKSAAEGKK